MSQDQPDFLSFDPTGLRFAIVASRYNPQAVDRLLGAVLETLEKAGVDPAEIETIRVPGAHEIPYAVHMLCETEQFDCLIALGVVIAGATDHHTIIAETTSRSLVQLSTDTEVPVINGILTVGSMDEALERCDGRLARGREFAHAALTMADIKVHLEARVSDARERLAAEDLFDDLNFLDDLKDMEDDDEEEEEDDVPPWKS